MEKECLNCGIVFQKSKFCSLVRWNNKKKYCSKKCSNENTLFKLGQEPVNKGKKRPEISKENHWNWKGGISGEDRLLRNSLESKLWREQVFQRDDYTCQECGNKNGLGVTVYLQAHHIKPWKLFPELRFEISNGMTLCRDCHRKTDTYGCLKNYTI